MTGGATDAFVDMNAVIEIDKPGKIMNPSPLNGLVVAKTIPHRCQRWAVSPDLAVAAHARLGGRNPRERAVFDRGMTVAAVYSIVADVMLVAEGDRLAASDADLRYVG